MLNLKTLLLFFVLLTTTIVPAQYTDIINSNRPGQSQSAYSLGKDVYQFESGIYGIFEKHKQLRTQTIGFGSELNLRAGLFFEELELNLTLQHQYDNFKTDFGTKTRNGFKQIIIGAKYLIYDPLKNYSPKINIHSWKANHKFKWRQFIPAVGIYAGTNLNFSNPYTFESEPTLTPKVALVTQNQFTGNYVLVMNFIADKFTSEFPAYSYIITFTKEFNKKWTGFVENQAIMSDYNSDFILRGGAAYFIKDDIQLDAAITSNTKNTPTLLYGGIGISWRFDKNYKPLWIRTKESKAKSIAAKKEKEIDKRKKDKKEIKKIKKEKEKFEKNKKKNLPTNP